MHAYGTDTTRRMYFTEYPVTAKAEVSFCVAIPPESEGEFVEWTESMPALCIYHHGAYEEMYDVAAKAFGIRQGKRLRTARYGAEHLSGGAAAA